MADLIEISDVETAIGRPPADATESAQWGFYITAVSSFINSLVDDSFEELTDDVLRYQADYYGVIHLKGGPVEEVTLVTNYKTGEELAAWDWDGLDKIVVRDALRVCNVTYTHGWATVPPDITSLCTNMVIDSINGQDSEELVSYQVGDVNEKFAALPSFNNSHTEDILDQYRDTEANWALGGSGRYPDIEPSDWQNV